MIETKISVLRTKYHRRSAVICKYLDVAGKISINKDGAVYFVSDGLNGSDKCDDKLGYEYSCYIGFLKSDNFKNMLKKNGVRLTSESPNKTGRQILIEMKDKVLAQEIIDELKRQSIIEHIAYKGNKYKEKLDTNYRTLYNLIMDMNWICSAKGKEYWEKICIDNPPF